MEGEFATFCLERMDDLVVEVHDLVGQLRIRFRRVEADQTERALFVVAE